MTARGLTDGSFGILEVQRRDERFAVSWDGLLVLSEAFDITGCGVPGHLLRFGQCSAIGDTARQCRDQDSEPSLRFGPENNVEMVMLVSNFHDSTLTQTSRGVKCGRSERGSAEFVPFKLYGFLFEENAQLVIALWPRCVFDQWKSRRLSKPEMRQPTVCGVSLLSRPGPGRSTSGIPPRRRPARRGKGCPSTRQSGRGAPLRRGPLLPNHAPG